MEDLAVLPECHVPQPAKNTCPVLDRHTSNARRPEPPQPVGELPELPLSELELGLWRSQRKALRPRDVRGNGRGSFKNQSNARTLNALGDVDPGLRERNDLRRQRKMTLLVCFPAPSLKREPTRNRRHLEAGWAFATDPFSGRVYSTPTDCYGSGINSEWKPWKLWKPWK